MITLSNGAEVLAAYLLPASPGMKPHGLVLAEYRVGVEWVTWDVYSNGDFAMTSDSANEIWEAESGHYFGPGSAPDPKAMAEYDFGLRLRRMLTDNMERAVHASSANA